MLNATQAADAEAGPVHKKAECLARLTALLMAGQVLTADAAREALGTRQSPATVLGWLRTLKEVLGDQIVRSEVSVDGGRPVVAYRHRDHGAGFEDTAAALSGLRTAERMLRHLEGTGLVDAIRAADTALAQRLPAGARVESTRHLLLRPEIPPLNPEIVGHANRLIEAIRRQRRTRVEYETRGGARTHYTFDPWAFVDHGRGLYVFGAVIRENADRRCLDLASIRAVHLTSERSARPDDCAAALQAYRRGRFGLYVDETQPVEVVLEVRGRALSFLTGRPLVLGQRLAPPGAGGWARLTAHLPVDPELVGHLLMLAPNVRVLGPPELGRQYRQALKAALHENSHD